MSVKISSCNSPNKSADLLLFLVKCFAMVASPVIALLEESFNCGVYKSQSLQINGETKTGIFIKHVDMCQKVDLDSLRHRSLICG